MVLVKWVLSAIVGVVIGFVLMLVNSGIFMLASSIIVGLLAAAFAYYGIFSSSGLGKLIAVVVFIVACILYLSLLIHLNETVQSLFWPMVPFFAPYIIAAYAFFAAKDSNGQKETDDGHTGQ